MNKHIITSLPVAIVLASCQPHPPEADGQNASTAPKDTVVSQNIQPAESGYADGLRYAHALEVFRAKGGGKMDDIHGVPKSWLAIMPGTTHIGMMQRTDWLIP